MTRDSRPFGCVGLRRSQGQPDSQWTARLPQPTSRRADCAPGTGERSPGNPGILGIQRNERAEGFERDMHGKLGIFKFDIRNRKFGAETCSTQPAESGRSRWTQACLRRIRRKNARLQHSRHRLSGAALRPNGGKRVVRSGALIGTVEYFPIAELPSASQARYCRSRCRRAGTKSDSTGGPNKRADTPVREADRLPEFRLGRTCRGAPQRKDLRSSPERRRLLRRAREIAQSGAV